MVTTLRGVYLASLFATFFPGCSGWAPRSAFDTRRPLASFSNDGSELLLKEEITTEEPDVPHLIFPGGGIFFYWQAGAVCYLREQGYNLDQTSLAGASAGALTATLTAADVDFYDATTLALDMAEEAGVWDRSGGLQGIWGPLIEDWLDELLPHDAADKVEGRLSLLVTPVPTFGKTKVDEFQGKSDLIRCNMASVHLPWFLDGRLTSDFRGSAHIDGSFLSKPEDYHPSSEQKRSVISLDWTPDPKMAGRAAEFVKAFSKEGIWSILEQGKRYAKVMEEKGDFEILRSV